VAIARSSTLPSSRTVVAVEVALLALAVLNGLAVRVFEAVRDGTQGGLIPGVGPFEMIAILVGLWLVARPDMAPERTIGWREVATACVLVLPSSTLSWLALAGYAALIAHDNVGDRRRGALILLALALAALWSSIGVRLVAEQVTAVEAALVTRLAGLFIEGLHRTGNVIGQTGGHHLVLLTACTSAEALPRALLAVIVVATFAQAQCPRRIAAAALATAVVFIAANTARLAVMSISSENYVLAHGPFGSSLFDAVQVALVIGAGYWASRA
jgi:hypothetical protein